MVNFEILNLFFFYDINFFKKKERLEKFQYIMLKLDCNHNCNKFNCILKSIDLM